MVILGTALLAGCYLLGIVLGDVLGSLIGVKANVGGVGIAMMLLMTAQYYLRKRGLMRPETERGVTFWAVLYIPVVVAMAATQNVVVAAKGGPIALLAAAGSVRALRLRHRRDQPRHPSRQDRHGLAGRRARRRPRIGRNRHVGNVRARDCRKSVGRGLRVRRDHRLGVEFPGAPRDAWPGARIGHRRSGGSRPRLLGRHA